MSAITSFLKSNNYSTSAYVLAGCYFALFIVAIIQLMRLLWNKHKNSKLIEDTERLIPGSTTIATAEDRLREKELQQRNIKHQDRILFQFIMMIAMAVKGTFFITYPILISDKVTHHYFVSFVLWKHIGSFYFLLAYLLLVIFWQEVYYTLNNMENIVLSTFKNHLSKIFLLLSFIVLFLALMGSLFLEPTENNIWKLDDTIGMILAVLSVLIAIYYVYYGILLSVLFKKYRILRVTVLQVRKLAFIVGGCTICFIARAVDEGYSVYDDTFKYANDRKSEMNQWTGSWVQVFTFYLIFEIIPAFVMVILLGIPNSPGKTEKSALLN